MMLRVLWALNLLHEAHETTKNAKGAKVKFLATDWYRL